MDAAAYDSAIRQDLGIEAAALSAPDAGTTTPDAAGKVVKVRTPVSKRAGTQTTAPRKFTIHVTGSRAGQQRPRHAAGAGQNPCSLRQRRGFATHGSAL